MTAPLLTAAEAARVLRVSHWQVAKWCHSGELRASKVGHWVISQDAIADFLAERSNVDAPTPVRQRRRRSA